MKNNLNKLENNYEIAQYIADLSPYDVCIEQIEEQFFGCMAVLRLRAVETLKPGSAEGNMADDNRQAVCDSLPIETMPPLLVDGDCVVDGNHRLRALIKRGASRCWVYEIQDI